MLRYLNAVSSDVGWTDYAPRADRNDWVFVVLAESLGDQLFGGMKNLSTENDENTRHSNWNMKVKKAMTPVSPCAAKRFI